jgi:hypothetical protein
MFAIGISTILVLVVCAFALFNGRSFAAIFNYVDLNQDNQRAEDLMSRDFRRVFNVQSFSTNSITFQDYDGVALEYTYNPASRKVTRKKQGENTVVLSGCDFLSFGLEQRNLVAGTFDSYAATNLPETKIIIANWSASRTLFGKTNMQTPHTARIVIRAPEGTFYNGTSTTNPPPTSGGTTNKGKGGGVSGGKKA